MPSMVIALWSDGPAPPRRLSFPALGSTSLTPKDCNSLINCSVGREFAATCVMVCAPTRRSECGRDRGTGFHRMRGAVVENELQDLRSGVMPHRVHHALALDDEI